MGNITSKGGASYTYDYNRPAGAGGPYALLSAYGSSYSYDANGNITGGGGGGGRSYTWNTENQPTSITTSTKEGVTETYTYDADNARVKRERASKGITTYYIVGGTYEEEVDTLSQETPITTTRTMYTFGGQVIGVVAQRTIVAMAGTNTLIYLHSDQLGSVGAATSSSGQLVSSQEYDPWGRVRTGGVTQTTRNYTGQKLDDTGLLFYNARYYDPTVGRFISPDSIVSGVETTKLSVDTHEAALLLKVNSENVRLVQEGFWYDGDKSGPGNPQAINRYSYVQNNPLAYTDPSGHLRVIRGAQANDFLFILDTLIQNWRDVSSNQQFYSSMINNLTNLGPGIVQFLSGVLSAVNYVCQACTIPV